ncbi:hypothetical protein CYMTET_51454 [Cymbomonas tetramitiformis]|uniref:Uncharacterized protein n=1 Tax=Cymbomonas tetramitiformis TaxID=36881 RepID=A0AAE0ESM7_9CHLO|nr:hypothetical protein CYMTET_51454 [Cymbomonas tetramitiformis]
MTRASSTWEYESMFGESSVHSEADWEDAVVTGTPLGEPPLISMISEDGVLRGTRLVAEAWDAGGLYQAWRRTVHGALPPPHLASYRGEAGGTAFN